MCLNVSPLCDSLADSTVLIVNSKIALVIQNLKKQNGLKSLGSNLVSSAVVVSLLDQFVHNNRDLFYSLCFVLVELFR